MAHGFDLVVHYNDVPADSAEFFSPVNVSRKIQAGAFIPLYIAPGMDITQEVVTALNETYRKRKEVNTSTQREGTRPNP